MRILTLLMLLSLTNGAWAQHASGDFVGTKYFEDPAYGTLKVDVRFIGEPIYAKFEMEITVLCKDRRRVKNLVQPAWEEVIPKERICKFVENEAKMTAPSVVSLTFGTSPLTRGQAECKGWTQPFTIRDLCTAWNN